MQWNGRTEAGTVAASGVYFVSLLQGEYTLSQRVVMLR